MSNRHTHVLAQQPLSFGRFQTTVNPLDDNGKAYAPGQASSGPKRVGPIGGEGGGTLPPDPYAGDAAPLGETPYVMMLILAITYIILTIRRRKKRVSA